MQSIGNDIIALNLIDKERTCQQRFYSRILNTAEQALYTLPTATSLPFEQFVWLLWSIKESVYKYLKRLNHQLIFSPTKIIVEHLNITCASIACKYDHQVFTGKVRFQEHDLYFYSTINQEYIHSVVTCYQHQRFIDYEVECIEQSNYETQSAAVKELALSSLSCLLPHNDDLQINKHIAGYPQVTSAGHLLPFPLSLAHHGHFVAFAFNNFAINSSFIS